MPVAGAAGDRSAAARCATTGRSGAAGLAAGPVLTGAAASGPSATARWTATGPRADGEPSAAGATDTAGSAGRDGMGEGMGDGTDDGLGDGMGMGMGVDECGGAGVAARWTGVAGESAVVAVGAGPVTECARGPGAGSSAGFGPPPSAPVPPAVPLAEACAGPVPADGAAGAGLAGSVRRWTGADVDLVNGAALLAGGGAAGDTRMPRAGAAGAGREAGAGRAATTGTSAGPGRPTAGAEAGAGAEAAAGADAVAGAAAENGVVAGAGSGAGVAARAGPGAGTDAGAGAGAGIVDIGIGIVDIGIVDVGNCCAGMARWSGVARGGGAGRSGSAAASAARGAARRLLIRPPGAASSTACGRTSRKEGFCQVASRPPNPASATPEGPAAAVRRMGGSEGQAAGTARAPAPSSARVGVGAGVP
ncbi:hypothetical protein OG802_18540 [Streptomyces sp. NBC_00704]|uniref:hypothetical protein n=1 Tax=Streptomyces sp. NBC_00704 TaxID=2975809 RepID=UPI002E330716|nr:hypothetical protein [Streptomyces sp. NBC_00704]